MLLLVAPGLAFFSAYHSGRFSIRYSNLTLPDQVFRSVIPGLTIQAFLIWVINHCSWLGYTVHLDTLGVLLLGAKEDKSIKEAFTMLSDTLGVILLYHITVITISALLGWASKEIVRYKKWDRRYYWLRYDNTWYYLLTGEVLEMPEEPIGISLNEVDHLDFVFVDVLVKLEKSNVIYSGILAHFELAADGGLQSVYLAAAQRKDLTTGKTDNTAPVDIGALANETVSSQNSTYYPVEGDILIIPYAQILNLNLSYWIDEIDAKKEGDTQKKEDAQKGDLEQQPITNNNEVTVIADSENPELDE